MRKELKNISKTISYILRHKPEKFNIELDENGWAQTSELINRLDIDINELEEIVETNNKKRFSFNNDKTKIRANQGHSIKNVDVELEKVNPPFKLYHGTTERFLTSILKEGLKPMNRQHVHLSGDLETAKNVGSRHGKVVILEVEAKEMYAAGLNIYKSENGVYLTDYIDPKYFEVL